MEALKRHLMKHWVVVPRQKDKPEKSEHKKPGENQDAVDEALFRGKMHENCRYQARFKRRHQHGHGDVRFARAKIDIRKCDCNGCKREQERAHHQITTDVLLNVVRVFLVLLWVLGNVRRVVHGLEQVKKWEDENPDQIHKMPEKAGYLNAISKMFGVALVKPLADRQPHVNEDQHAAEHMHAMQTSNREVTGKVRAVPRQEHRSVLDVFLFDLGNLVGRRHIEKVRSVHRGIGGIGV